MPDLLHRAFPWIPGIPDPEPGGVLFVPRSDQGFGRHDSPDRYGTVYLSRTQVSAAAEVLRMLRIPELRNDDLRIEGAVIALAAFDGPAVDELVDLDDPRTLGSRDLRPSAVATGNRELTQEIAAAIFDEGHISSMRLAGDPEVLTVDHPALRDASEVVGVKLAP
jgi:hypothetical protein